MLRLPLAPTYDEILEGYAVLCDILCVGEPHRKLHTRRGSSEFPRSDVEGEEIRLTAQNIECGMESDCPPCKTLIGGVKRVMYRNVRRLAIPCKRYGAVYGRAPDVAVYGAFHTPYRCLARGGSRAPCRTRYSVQ